MSQTVICFECQKKVANATCSKCGVAVCRVCVCPGLMCHDCLTLVRFRPMEDDETSPMTVKR